MLPTHIEENEFYTFAVDQRRGHHVVFATQEMMTRNGSVEPLWHREAGDERSLRALRRWVGVRRDRWQEWGRLAECIGTAAFYQHMRDLMAAEPVEECTGTVVQHGDDPQEIILGEMMHGLRGVHIETLYRHRFVSPAARSSFFDWFYTDRNCDLAAGLLQVAYSKGTAELGRRLDELVADLQKPLSRAERRRRAKAEAKVKA